MLSCAEADLQTACSTVTSCVAPVAPEITFLPVRRRVQHHGEEAGGCPVGVRGGDGHEQRTRVPELNVTGGCVPPTAGLCWHRPLPRQHLEPQSCLQRARAAGSTPPRAPWLFPPSPASFPPALRPAGCCSAYPGPSSSSVPSRASSLLSGSSPQRCTGNRALACRGRGGGRRKCRFSCDGAKRAERAPASPGHPHHPRSSKVWSPVPQQPAPPWRGRAWRTLSCQGLFQVGLLQPIFGKLGAAWWGGSWQGCLVPARARLSRTRTPLSHQKPCPLLQVHPCPPRALASVGGQR